MFGGFDGLMKGLSSFLPQDDPDAQLFKLQTEVSDLQKQERSLYEEMGRQALQRYGPEAFGDLAHRLQLIQANLAAAQEKLQGAQSAKKQAEEAQQAARALRTCPACGYENPEGTKFCQECGSKLGPAAKTFCPNCGQENPPGTKFCGGCGTRLEG